MTQLALMAGCGLFHERFEIPAFMFDDKLTFSDHVTQEVKKVVGRIRRLYRAREFSPETLSKLLSILSFNTAHCTT